MTTPTVIKTTTSDIDSQNRQFIWTQYSDGSALSCEITRCTGDAARPAKETWREFHEAGSTMALMICAW